jgi:hypothetical protein
METISKKVMFEAAEPEVFAWYIKSYGTEVNLFVDHSPDCSDRVSESRHLGNEEPLGPGRDLRGVRHSMGSLQHGPIVADHGGVVEPAFAVRVGAKLPPDVCE